MEHRRARLILLAAFVLSLLAHAIVALIVRGPLRPPPEEGQIVTMHTRAAVVSVRRLEPTPPPHKPKRAPPKAVHVPVLAAVPVAHASPGRAQAERTPRPVRALPSIAPPAKVACTAANQPAGVVGTPPPVPAIAANARAQAASGTARIAVQLNPRGRVTGSSIVQSSGSAALDALAQRMAAQTSYQPALTACKAVASTYVFSVRFAAW